MSRERELEEKVRHLEEINDQKDRLLGMVGHELRNPLAAIRSAAEVLRLTLGSEPRVQKTYDIVERQTASMVRLLDRIGDVSKLARGKLTLERAVVDLGEILTRAVEASATTERSVPLGVLWVDADAARLRQIFDALLSGAVRVSAEKGATDAIVRFEHSGAEIDALVMKLAEGIVGLHGGTVTSHRGAGRAQLELRLPLATR